MLDLEQVYEDQDADFYIQQGVKRGISRRYIRDVGRWAKLYGLAYDEDGEH
jgi:hypothetical protein